MHERSEPNWLASSFQHTAAVKRESGHCQYVFNVPILFRSALEVTPIDHGVLFRNIDMVGNQPSLARKCDCFAID
jgi:hypothetical protein